jgi:hypothetical protein
MNPNLHPIPPRRWLAGGLLALVGVIDALVFVRFFEMLPTEGTSFALDNLMADLAGWDIRYHLNRGFRNPPWSLLVLIPVGSLLSPRASWGILVFLTVVVLVWSVPRTNPRWLFWLCVLLLVTSHPALRNAADSNYEGLVIGGLLLLVGGYTRANPVLLAAGALQATMKPQSTVLLIPVLGVYLLQSWQPRRWLIFGGLVLAVVIPTLLWRGADWLATMRGTYTFGDAFDISLRASLHRLGVVSPSLALLLTAAIGLATLAAAWFGNRTLSREKVGLLVAGSMLIAPYAAGNSLLTLLAIGIIPLMIERKLLGWLLFIQINLEYLWIAVFPVDFRQVYQGYWSTLVLLLAWGVLLWHVYHTEIAARRSVVADSPTQ